VRNIDKKKSELYFSLPVKKFLTEKAKRACPQATNFSHFIRQVISSRSMGIFFAPAD
jgi:hypothetical protein